MTKEKLLTNRGDEDVKPWREAKTQEEIKNILKDEYYWSFDDGNHPGQYDIYEAKDLEEQIKMHKLETTQQEKKPDEQVILGENDFLVEDRIEPEIFARLEANQEKLPCHMILEKLKNYQTVSCELQRRPKEKSGWWTTAVWPALWFESVGLGEIFTMKKEKLEGNIVLYLTFKTINSKPLTISVSAKLVEFPDTEKWAMINTWIVFTKKLNGKEFEQEKKLQ